MNIAKLNRLEKLARNHSLLYVDSDKKCLAQNSRLFRKCFSSYWEAFDGRSAYGVFLNKLPDIVILNAKLSRKNSLELILDIQLQKEDTLIVILSEKNDDLILIQSLDMGLDIIYKPSSIDEITEFLTQKLLQINNNLYDYEFFETLYKNNYETLDIQFLNSFKGLKLKNKGSVLKVDKDEILVQIPKTQFIGVSYEKYTIIYISNLQVYVKFEVFKLIKHKNQVSLINPIYLKDDKDLLNSKMFSIDETFQITLYKQNQQVDIKPCSVSTEFIQIIVNKNIKEFNLNDSVDLKLRFELENKTALLHEKRFENALAKGEVKKIIQKGANLYILIKLEVKKADQRVFNSYVSKIEAKVLKEFKELLRG